MINSNYNNLYYGYLNAVEQNNRAKSAAGQRGNTASKAGTKKADSAPTSPRYESLEKAMSKGKSRGTTTNMEEIAGKTNATAGRSESKSTTDETDVKSVFARLRDAQMALYGGGHIDLQKRDGFSAEQYGVQSDEFVEKSVYAESQHGYIAGGAQCGVRHFGCGVADKRERGEWKRSIGRSAGRELSANKTIHNKILTFHSLGTENVK